MVPIRDFIPQGGKFGTAKACLGGKCDLPVRPIYYGDEPLQF